MDDQQNRSIFYIHRRHMPTKSGKVTKGYKKKKTWAASRRAPGWKPAKQSKYFSTTIMGCAPSSSKQEVRRTSTQEHCKTKGLHTVSASTSSTTQTWHTT